MDDQYTMTKVSSPDLDLGDTGPIDNNVYVLDRRRRAALAEVDNANLSWFHAKVVFVAGVGFFTDAYSIFAIDVASVMLGYLYGPLQSTSDGQTQRALSRGQNLGIKVATPIGTLVGQLLFGWLADRLGRKKMYGIELIIMIIATFVQATSGYSLSVNIIGILIVWRFIMGIGVGADYPLSAVIASEFSAARTRGRLMTAVFASQGWGNLGACLVALAVVRELKNPLLHEDPTHLLAIDRMWRLLIGLGCVPGCIALYFRLTIPETPRFTMDVERNLYQATTDINSILNNGRFYRNPIVAERVRTPKASRLDFAQYFSKWENLKILIGTTWSWFALDIAFYGLGLNSSDLLQGIGFGKSSEGGVLGMYRNLYNVCIGKLILAVAGLIPGYYASFLLIDSWGRKPIQLMGFVILTVLFIVMGFAYDALLASRGGVIVFVFLICLANFFQNFGPNTTTFVVPGEAFPTRYRSTAHGISAASGKFGAIVAQVGFAQLQNIGGTDKFVKHILQIFAFFMLTGIFSTMLLPETKGRTLEEISNERQIGFIDAVEGPPRRFATLESGLGLRQT